MARPIRERLMTAADLLQEAGHDNAAADVRAVVAPGGWKLLHGQPGTGQGPASNVAMSVSVALKASLFAAAGDIGVSLSAVAADGYRAVIEGRWTPPKLLMDRTASRPKSTARVNLNVRIPDTLINQVRLMLPELTKALGYRVSLASIAITWLAEELGVDLPSGDDSETLKMVTHRLLVEHVNAQAAERGLFLSEVLEAGIRDLLSGERVPQTDEWHAISSRPRSSGKWQVDPNHGLLQSGDPAKLSVRVDADLMADLREWCAERTEEAEWPVYPGAVGIAVLKDRLGEPAAE